MTASCNEEGYVLKRLSDDRAVIVVERGEACGACAAKGACQTLGGPHTEISMVVDNPVNAEEGDTVRITLDEKAVIKASAILYLIPALFLISGAVLGHLLAPTLDVTQDPAAIVGALSGILMGLLVSWALGRLVVRHRSIVPRLTAIVNRRGTIESE